MRPILVKVSSLFEFTRADLKILGKIELALYEHFQLHNHSVYL